MEEEGSITDAPSPTSPEELRQAKEAYAELKEKMERWKSATKVGIDEHRKRITELTLKLTSANTSISHLTAFVGKFFTYLEETGEMFWAHLTDQRLMTLEMERNAVQTILEQEKKKQESLSAEIISTWQVKVNERDKLNDELHAQLRELREEMVELSSVNDQLEAKVDTLCAQNHIVESSATRDAVALALKAAQENFSNVEAAIRLQCDSEMKELRFAQEVELNNVRDALAQELDAVRLENAALRHQCSRTIEKSHSSALSDPDESYIALFETNKQLECDLKALRDENKKLENEVSKLMRHNSAHNASIATEEPQKLVNLSTSKKVSTLSEAQVLIAQLEVQIEKTQRELCDREIQLRALREHPPTLPGSLLPEQAQYAKELIVKLYTAPNKDHMMKSLAPVLGQLLNIPVNDFYKAKK